MAPFDRENQAVLDLALARCQEVGVVQAKAATPGWVGRCYKPLVQLALDKKVTLLAANFSNVDVCQIVTDGLSAVFSPQFTATYKRNQIPPSTAQRSNKAIQDGRCKMLPVKVIGSMAQGQMVRDVRMASVVNGIANPMIVLVAGNGHVR